MSTTMVSSSPVDKHKNKMRKIVSTWQRFARSRKAADQGVSPTHKLPNEDTFVVLVGKERRRYVLGERYLQIPLFRSLLEKSKAKATVAADEEEDGLFVVPCEVVMFEHLLWMLDNGNATLQHAESVDELVDFYSY